MKVAIYCRLSEEDKKKQNDFDDSLSIQNQKSMLINYATEKEWEIYNIYSDDDYTGADRNRPEFNKLLADAEKRKFEIILCKSQSRFTRELEIVEKYIHGLFLLWKIRFISIVDNADTEVKGNKKSRQINGLVNEWYLEDMSENIKSALTTRRRQGYHIGAFPLYGYVKDPNKKGHLIIDPEAAEIVREVFMLYSQGYGKTAIARLLNDKGIPNPMSYRIQKGYLYRKTDLRTGKLWKYNTISDMLTNQMYIGNMVQGRYGSISYKSKKNKQIPKNQWIIVEGTHEPIVDTELWENVQRKVNANFKPFTTGEIGIFAKKVKCMYCGYTMRSKKTSGKKNNFRYLTCTTRHVSKGACKGSFVTYKLLEQVMIDELNRIIAEYLDIEAVEQHGYLENNFTQKLEALSSDMDTYIKRVNEYSKAIKELYIDKVRGVITESDYISFSKDFYHDKEKIEKHIVGIQNQINIVKDQLKAYESNKTLMEYYSISILTRDIVDKYIDCIFIGKREQRSVLPIEVHWSF